VGEAQAGDQGAILYTIIESSRRRGVDPYSYRRDVLMLLPEMTNRQIPAIVPAEWAKFKNGEVSLKAAS
jgi:transposase